MKNWILVAAAVTVISCKKEEKIAIEKSPAKFNTETFKKQESKIQRSIKLEAFAFPQEIEGCSCYFAVDREQFIKQNYIYVDDYQKNAFLRINGRQIKLGYDKKNEVLPEKSLNINASNPDYKLHLKGKIVEQGEIETALYKGTLTVETMDGKKTETPVYGECGC